MLSMKCRYGLACLLAAALALAPLPVMAQGPLTIPEAEVLLEAGKWLLGYLAGKTVDPVVDIILGRDTEKKIQAVEARLQKQLNQNTANRQQVEKELAVARSELKALRQLMTGTVTPKQITGLREELSSDVKTIQSTLAEHERRLAEHDHMLAEQGKLIESQGREIDGLRQRLDRVQPQAPQSPDRGSGLSTIAPPRSSIPAGAILTIQVRGKENLIRLRDATHPVAMGTFRFSRNHALAAYFLPPEARAVIELFAPDNRISMPAHLAGQVQILSHGFRYETLEY